MKTALFKTAFAAIVVIFALFLGTCAPQLPEVEEADVEYTDVEYGIAAGANGNIRVSSVKLYLDGVKVPVTRQQRAIQRALSYDTAAASHDYFEAVFQVNATNVARAAWKIGSPSGIQGLKTMVRGVDASGVTFRNQPWSAAAACATVFVGKETNKTLLGVGWLTDINDSGAVTVIDDDTFSVTFTVAPLKTWVGFSAANTPTQRANLFGDAGTGQATFILNTTNATPGNTQARGNTVTFSPVPSASVLYPVYELEPAPTTTPVQKYGVYRIGGLSGVTTAPAPPGTGASLWQFVRNYGTSAGAIRGGLQVIKRKPTYVYRGRTYEAGDVYDSFTNVTILPAYVTAASHGSPFDHEISLVFTVTNQTQGIFSFTFQAPVYAITTADHTNTGAAGKFTKWFVRPADGANLYLLDSGFDEGGMVMLGDMNAFSDDWIEIKTIGIGFQNN